MNAVRVAILVATAAVCCVSSSPALARPADTPLQMGLAGAGSLLLHGVDAPFGNPATLSWDRTPAVRLAASTGAVLNDTYTLHDYSRWNGATWSEDDKEEIRSRIGFLDAMGDVEEAHAGTIAVYLATHEQTAVVVRVAHGLDLGFATGRLGKDHHERVLRRRPTSDRDPVLCHVDRRARRIDEHLVRVA